MRPDAARAQLEALRALTVEERLVIADSLRQFAWRLKASVIARRHPELSEAEVQRRVHEALGRDPISDADPPAGGPVEGRCGRA
jgi:hypothetical protein